MSNMSKFHEDYAALTADALEKLKADFKEFFAANPDVFVFGLRTYRPSFNDGDACLFTITGIYARLTSLQTGIATGSDENDEDENDEDGDDLEYPYGVSLDWGQDWFLSNHPELTAEQVITIKNCYALAGQIYGADQLIEQGFGEGVKVKITLDDISIETYRYD